jgi:hypothetical protein
MLIVFYASRSRPSVGNEKDDWGARFPRVACFAAAITLPGSAPTTRIMASSLPREPTEAQAGSGKTRKEKPGVEGEHCHGTVVPMMGASLVSGFE